MNLYARRGFSVTHTDNGWVLEWMDDTLENWDDRIYSRKGTRTRGIEVFTKKEDLVKRINTLL